MNEVLNLIEDGAAKPRSCFQRRVNLIKNGRRYSEFGYTSMPSFLFNSMWSHFFDKEVRL